MNLANNLTILRIFLTPAFIITLFYYTPSEPWFKTLAISIFSLACVTDALDGYIARRFNQQTLLGSYIDPIADKLLLVSGFIALSFMTSLPSSMRVPIWLTISVITRDVVIVVGSLVIFIATGSLKARPSKTGKLTTVLQMTSLVLALLGAEMTISKPVFIFTAILTLISGIQYVRMGGRLMG